jgi:MFS superfamily sulfate permease-like transporter
MGDAAGGRTQVTGQVAAAAIAAVLLFFTEPLRYVPIPALGAVLVFAAFSLFDVGALREIWKIDKREVALSVLTTLGVVALGAINAILVAVGLALVRFVRIAARPLDEVLGKVEGLPGLHSVERHPGATTWPGIVIYRFDGPISFFNSAYFKQCALRAADAAGAELKWFVLDMIPVSQFHVTGLYAVRDVREALAARGVRLVFAGRKTELLHWARQAGLYNQELDERTFPTIGQAFKAYRRQTRPAEAPPVED